MKSSHGHDLVWDFHRLVLILLLGKCCLSKPTFKIDRCMAVDGANLTFTCTLPSEINGTITFLKLPSDTQGSCRAPSGGSSGTCGSGFGFDVSQNLTARTTTLFISAVNPTQVSGTWYCRYDPGGTNEDSEYLIVDNFAENLNVSKITVISDPDPFPSRIDKKVTITTSIPCTHPVPEVSWMYRTSGDGSSSGRLGSVSTNDSCPDANNRQVVNVLTLEPKGNGLPVEDVFLELYIRHPVFLPNCMRNFKTFGPVARCPLPWTIVLLVIAAVFVVMLVLVTIIGWQVPGILDPVMTCVTVTNVSGCKKSIKLEWTAEVLLSVGSPEFAVYVHKDEDKWVEVGKTSRSEFTHTVEDDCKKYEFRIITTFLLHKSEPVDVEVKRQHDSWQLVKPNSEDCSKKADKWKHLFWIFMILILILDIGLLIIGIVMAVLLDRDSYAKDCPDWKAALALCIIAFFIGIAFLVTCIVLLVGYCGRKQSMVKSAVVKEKPTEHDGESAVPLTKTSKDMEAQQSEELNLS